VYAPDGATVIVSGLGLVGHRRDWGRDTLRADAPVIRVRGVSLFGTIDVWHVPPDGVGDYGEIIRRLRGGRRQLPS
jgi:hypothetical protein